MIPTRAEMIRSFVELSARAGSAEVLPSFPSIPSISIECPMRVNTLTVLHRTSESSHLFSY